MNRINNTYIATTALCLAPLLWAGNFVIAKIVHQDLPPLQFAFYRWLLVIIILQPFVKTSVLKHINTIKKNIFLLSIQGLLSVSIYTAFIYLGMHLTTVINATLINALIPVFIVILSYIYDKQKIAYFKLAGIFVSLLGVVLLITHGQLRFIIDVAINSGDYLVIIAVIAWAVFSVLMKETTSQLPPLTFLFITALFGELFLIVPFLLEIFYFKPMMLNWSTCLSIGYASIFSSLLAFTFWNLGVCKIGPVKASYYLNLLPLYSALLAIILLGESIGIYQVEGGIIIFLGIIISNIKDNKIK